MKSTYKVVWSENSLSELKEIIEYLESNWTGKETSKFFKKLEKTIKQISINPLMFPKTEKKESVRRCVLSKQLTLYYQTDTNYLYIISLFDNRRNPKTKKN
jgi:plasmid stabilization system protein ParE